MPKLPTPEDFTRQNPSASRPIVSYQSGIEARATQGLGKTLSGVASMIETEQKKLDDIRAEDALNKAKMSALELSQGDNGFTKVKGEGVVNKPIRNDYSNRFNQSMKRIESDLSPSQLETFRRRSSPLNLSYQSSLLGHIGKETSSYQDTTDLATLDIETQEAAAGWSNPQTVVDSMERIKYTVNSIAERKGLGKDAKTKLLNENITKMHKGVIYSMLESTPAQAKIYYEKNKKNINELDRLAISTKLKLGTVKLESQSLTDEVIAKDLSYADSLAWIRKKSGKDADLRESSVSLFKQRSNETDRAIKDATYDADIYIADKGSLDGFPKDSYDLIPQSKRNAIEKVARELRQGVEPIQDHLVWADYNTLVGQAYAGNKTAIDKLKNTDVYSELRLKLDDSHYDQALSFQRAFVTNDAKEKSKAGDLAGKILTNKASADVFINRLLGVKKTSGRGGRNKQGVRFADQFYQLAQAEFDQWGIDNPKKKIPAAERDEIFRNLAQTMSVEDGGFMYFDKDYDITDIPEKHLNEIADDLRENNIPVTGKNLVSAYLAAKEKGLIK